MIRTFDLKYDLISVLVERWYPETHIFHLSYGDCTITLEHVALQLRLPIDNSAVTGVNTVSELATLCYDLLGHSPGDGGDKFMSLRYSWLKENFEYLPSTTIEQEMLCTTRAYIMYMIEGVVMPNANNNKVQLMYLPLLSDFYATHLYSWGSIVLATLYRVLFQITKRRAVNIGGCLVLLQSWALYQMPFLELVTHQTYVFPLVNI
ncbi:serine/threonine-protein phosphatase 7 long form homolog [Gossypium hirsutum]|uniref:Serine/threonine-protein phosphatase 7 long form homolog n=1 Tax=Gossypium hirsutum TaxID=3635 RepID=A0A1U8MRG0_GOSHI|nr:serine/threonine-protein phosphatase 7 long form homolog [Gossypium hirsutum]